MPLTTRAEADDSCTAGTLSVGDEVRITDDGDMIVGAPNKSAWAVDRIWSEDEASIRAINKSVERRTAFDGTPPAMLRRLPLPFAIMCC
jgi:hypothetical protein